MNYRMQRCFALILAVILTLSLCACGKKSLPFSKGIKEDGRLAWYLGGNNLLKAEVDPKTLFKDTTDTIDPAAIYNSLEWTEQMLRGVYGLDNPKKDKKAVLKEIPMEEVAFKEEPLAATILPIAVYLGKDNITSAEGGLLLTQYKEISDHEIAVLEFAAENAPAQAVCTYEIQENAIVFKQIRQTSAVYDSFTYEFTGNEFSFDFALSGPYLTLSRDGYSLQLKAYCVTKSANEQLYLRGYSQPDSPLVHNLDHFACSSVWNYAVKRDGSYYDLSAFKFDDTGRFTVYLEDDGQVFTQQYAYILQSSANGVMDGFSVLLMDGEKFYDYADSDIQREVRALEEQGVDVSELTEEDIESIVEKKADLFDDLYQAFQEQGINATINRSTGEIALGATILFDLNESAISGNGKDLLKEFMAVYTSVVFSKDYENFVSKILIEGHTDTSGSQELNQQLSLERAESVRDFCLSEECGNYADTLQPMLEAVGCGYDKPIYDENGEVDMDASRRVSFKFIVNTK